MPNGILSGQYDVSMDLFGKQKTGVLTLVQKGDSLSGRLKSPDLSLSFANGKVTGNRFSFSGVVPVMIFKIPFSAQGESQGERITISADTKYGVFTIHGTRRTA